MVNYKCYFCNYETNKLCNLKNHIFKKNKCSYLIIGLKIDNIDKYYELVELHKKEPDNDIWGIDYKNQSKPSYDSSDDNNEVNPLYTEFMNKMVYNKKFYCEYCDKPFSRKDNLKTHYKTCKEKLKQEILLLKKENETLKNIGEIDEKMCNRIVNNIDNSITNNNIDNSIDNSITNNNTINNTIVVKLNNYGEENQEILLDEKYLLKLLKEPFNAIPEMIKKIHFSPEKTPENTNIRVNNISNGKIQIFKKEWKTKIKKTIVKDLIDKYSDLLIEKYDDLESLGTIKKKNYKTFSQFRNKLIQYYNNNEELDFMKDQEQQVDCMLIDCCKKNKEYLKNL